MNVIGPGNRRSCRVVLFSAAVCAVPLWVTAGDVLVLGVHGLLGPSLAYRLGLRIPEGFLLTYIESTTVPMLTFIIMYNLYRHGSALVRMPSFYLQMLTGCLGAQPSGVVLLIAYACFRGYWQLPFWVCALLCACGGVLIVAKVAIWRWSWATLRGWLAVAPSHTGR